MTDIRHEADDGLTSAARDTAIINENLSALDTEASRLSVKRAAHLAEKLHLLCTRVPDSKLYELIRRNYENEELFDRFRTLCDRGAPADIASEEARVLSCQLAARIFGGRGCEQQLLRFLSDSFTDGNAARHGTKPETDVTYFKNYYADRAYTIFSEQNPGMTVRYADDFQGVCETVFSGQADSCILPIENEQNGFLLSFYRLLERFGLKIAMRCAVADTATGGLHRFLLLKRYFVKPDEPAEKRTFDIALTVSDEVRLGDVIITATKQRLSVNRVYGGVGGENGSYGYYLSFSGAIADIASFLTWLSLFVPQFSVLGYYPLETGDFSS